MVGVSTPSGIALKGHSVRRLGTTESGACSIVQVGLEPMVFLSMIGEQRQDDY